MLVKSLRLNNGLTLGGSVSAIVTRTRRGAVQVTVTGIGRDGCEQLRRCGITSGSSIWCREGESLELGADVAITPTDIRRSGIRLAIDAPRSVRVQHLEGANVVGVGASSLAEEPA